jgi:hypothetical protein
MKTMGKLMDDLMKKIRREKEGKARGHHRYVQYSRIRLTAAMNSKRFTTTPRDSHTINFLKKRTVITSIWSWRYDVPT